MVMAHLKTKATTGNMAERARWKWQLVRGLDGQGYEKQEFWNCSAC